MKTHRSNYWRELVFESSLSTVVKMTAVAVASHVDNSTGAGYCAQPRLVAITSASVRSVRDSVTLLEELGLLEVTRSTGRGNAHSYQLTLPRGFPAERPDDVSEVRALSASLTKAAPPAAFAEPKKAAAPAGESRKAAPPATKAAPPAGNPAPPASLLLSSSPRTSPSPADAGPAAPAAVHKPSITGYWQVLSARLDAMLEEPEYRNAPLTAYTLISHEAESREGVLRQLSDEPIGFVQDKLLAHAARYLLEDDTLEQVESKSWRALGRTRKLWGSDGFPALLAALAETAVSSFSDDPLRYAIKVARTSKEAS